MRLLRVFQKTLREFIRDPLSLSLTLAFAPVMVLLYWLFFPSGSTTYGVLILNRDRAVVQKDAALIAAGRFLIDAVQEIAYADGNPMLKVRVVEDRVQAETLLRNRDASVLVVVPEGFSRTILDLRENRRPDSVQVTFVGDLTNPYYAVAAVLANTGLERALRSLTGQGSAVQIREEPLGGSAARTEFENYVPGLFIFAVILLVFLAAMTAAKEVETGTLRRLRLSRMTAFDFLGGVSLALVFVGIVALLVAFGTAVTLGFRSQGPVGVAIAAGGLTALSVIGVGMVVACFSKTVSQAFVIANFPLAVLMFFSGAAFPMPKTAIFSIAGRTIGLYDVLPATHAVAALHKVLTMGTGFGGVGYEFTALGLLSILYFTVGVFLFQRLRMKAE